jgi:hypothetical protein
MHDMVMGFAAWLETMLWAAGAGPTRGLYGPLKPTAEDLSG